MKIFIFLICFFATSISHAETPQIILGQFSKSDLTNWQEEEFKGKTKYKFVKDDNRTVLRAFADNSASGLFNKTAIDIKKYPYINWSWKTTNRLTTDDEKTKKGDDYTARIYVLVSGGVFFWKTKAINYVWSNKQAKESIWPNAFAPSNAMMLSVRSNKDKLGTWYHEKRNIFADMEKIFGEKIDQIDAIAIMVDTDNSGGTATSYFGDIYFTAE